MFFTNTNPYMVASDSKVNLNPKGFILVEQQTSADEVHQTLLDRYRDKDGDGYLDIDPNEKLSDNFKYKELIHSDNAIKYGLENRVPASMIHIVENAKYTATTCLEVIRNKFGGFAPNSWYRGPEVEYMATYKDGFSKYVTKSYRRSNNSEPTAAELVTIINSTMYHRDLVRNALSSKSHTYAIILELWDRYYAGKQHPLGEAVDLEVTKSGSNGSLFNWIKNDSKIQYDQLILEFHKPNMGAFTGWVHISTTETARTGKKNRLSAFSI